MIDTSTISPKPGGFPTAESVICLIRETCEEEEPEDAVAEIIGLIDAWIGYPVASPDRPTGSTERIF